MTQVKKKLCWNCEGNVTFDEENCPYCAVYLHPEESENTDYTPPYPLDPELEETENTPSSEEQTAYKDYVKEMKHITLSLTLLATGTLFILFSLLLLFFSYEGFLTLRWNSYLWPYFLFLSFPLLFLGIKQLKQISDD